MGLLPLHLLLLGLCLPIIWSFVNDCDSRVWDKTISFRWRCGVEDCLHSSRDRLSVSNSIQDNLVACSNWSFVDSFEALLNDKHNHDIEVAAAFGVRQELDDYLLKTPYTLTFSNKKFGNATVKGRINVADTWASKEGLIWQLPSHHPRNALRRECVAMSKESSHHPSSFYPNRSEKLEPFYVMKVRNAFIHDDGIIGLECGYFQHHEGCELLYRFVGKRWSNECTKKLSSHNKSWSDMIKSARNNEFTHENYFGCTTELVVFKPKRRKNKRAPTAAPTPPPKMPLPTYQKKVFVISANWDNNYHHFIVDGIIRMIRYWDFIQSNPDIKIHIRTIEKFARKERYVAGGIALRQRILNLLGIDLSRLVSGSVIADEVYVPRSTVCNSQISHALELRLLAKLMIARSFPHCRGNNDRLTIVDSNGFRFPAAFDSSLTNSAHLESPSFGLKKKLILQHRHCLTKEECDKTWREWDSPTFARVHNAFEKAFSQHQIVVLSSSDNATVNCLDCQIREYAGADVLVGIHGAGMTNVMFMQPESLLVEIVGQFDGRMLPVCGYHGPLVSIFGIHHYIYYYDWKGNEDLNPEAIAQEALAFYSSLQKKTTASLAILD